MVSQNAIPSRQHLGGFLIMRAFVRLRQMISLNRSLAKRLASIERRLSGHDVDVRKFYRMFQEMQESPSMADIGYAIEAPKT
jgi:hypothetical protein